MLHRGPPLLPETQMDVADLQRSALSVLCISVRAALCSCNNTGSVIPDSLLPPCLSLIHQAVGSVLLIQLSASRVTKFVFEGGSLRWSINFVAIQFQKFRKLEVQSDLRLHQLLYNNSADIYSSASLFYFSFFITVFVDRILSHGA